MWKHVKRDTLLFVLGAGGFLHELLLSSRDRPTIIAASLAMMGLPFVLNGRGKRNGNGG